jgi:crotonobetainyl-CoA:carnitine CoA-transferase CaiB-like acyl-CoA transferase
MTMGVQTVSLDPCSRYSAERLEWFQLHDRKTQRATRVPHEPIVGQAPNEYTPASGAEAQLPSMKPLHDIRVLDLSRVVSGPFCTMLLGDLGAEVIKIEEPPGGDESRTFGPPFVAGESAYYLAVNRNKKSCTLDLKSDDGKRVLTELARRADVLVDNFRPGTLARLGFDDAWAERTNPRLIRCSISGFGTRGPDAHRPGYDLVVQGESGIMDITGFPDGPPTKVGTSVGDLVTGLYAAQGILAALVERDRTGRGTRVEVAMLDALASLLTFNAGMYFATGKSPTRRGNAHPSIYPYETFEAADGWINVGVANDKFWTLFCNAVEAPELLADRRFATAPSRVEHRGALQPALVQIFLRHPRAHWMDVLGKAGVPCGAIRTVAEVCEAEQLLSRGMIVSIPHPTAGEVRSIFSPVRFGDRDPAGNAPPPLLGQHTDEILRTVAGLASDDVARLRAAGVLGPPATQASHNGSNDRHTRTS